MRIINRHYSHLLVGYDGILDFSRQFAEAWEKESQSRAQSYRRELDEYQRRYDSWLAANQPRVDAYNTAYEAWFRSETPTREAYQKALVQWKLRYETALRLADAGLQKAQKKFGAYQQLALIFGIVAAFIWMLLCLLTSLSPSPLYWIGLTMPVAASGVFAFLSKRWEMHYRVYARRKKSILSVSPPQYKPLSPPPVHPNLPPEPEKPFQRSMPGFKPMAELWWDRLSEKPADVAASDRITYGSEGEALLVEALKDTLSDDFLAISGMKVERSTDADVVVIGKNGIWVLESKYLSGWVTYDADQGWAHWTESRSEYSSPEYTLKERYDYTDEWQREKKSIETTLNMHMKRPHPPVLGGIAFTHDAELKCDDLPPVQIGWIRDWCERIKSTQCDDRFTERDLVECAHHILNYSHRLDDKNSQASAGDLAFNLKNLYFEKLH